MGSIKTLGFVIPSLGSGGAERVVALLAEALSADFTVHVLLAKGATRHFDVARANLHIIDYSREGILSAIRDLKIDLVLDHYHWDADHVRLMSGLAQEGLRVVLTEHNAWHYPLFQWARDRRPGHDAWFTERYAHYTHFAAVTVLNDAAFRYFSQHLTNLCTLPNPAPRPASRRFDPQSRRLLTVSHFQKKAKRLDLLYRSFADLRARLPDASLTVLGDYDAVQDRYCRLAAGLGDAPIETPGRTTRVDSHFDRSALFALTSEIEGQPMVLLEAAQHGMPQIAFDLPGLSDQLIHGETGLLVPPGDTAALADAAASLLTDPLRLVAMGQAARALVQDKFSLRRILGLWRSLIAEIEAQGRITSQTEPLPAPLAQADRQWQSHWARVARHDDPGLVPKVSFLVPVYGTEELLPRCLRSIQAQTLTNFECLIVDDASPGDVWGTVRATVGDDARFQVIEHAYNRGLYQARSTAAEAARGLYYAHIDSDDYIHHLFAETLFNEAILTGAEIVECQAIELREDGRPIRFNQIENEGPVDGAQAARAFLANRLRNVVWNKLYARDLWHRVPGHMQIDRGLSICEDLLRNSLLFPECRRYASVADCLYYYCRRPASVVKGGDMRRLLAKLADIDFAYATAKARQAAPEAAANWHMLEARRVEDVQWYVAEYLERHDFDTVQDELRQMQGEIDPQFATIVHLVAVRARQKADLARAWKDLRWERDRARKLEDQLKRLRDLMVER